MEPEFSEPMLFDRGDGTVQDQTFDPAQVWGVQSTVPRTSVPLSLQDVRSPDSSALGLSSVYEYKHLVAYLKVNSRDKDRPLMPFGVSGRLHWAFLIQVVVCTVLHWLYVKVWPYLLTWVFIVILLDVCKELVIYTGRKSF